MAEKPGVAPPPSSRTVDEALKRPRGKPYVPRGDIEIIPFVEEDDHG